MASACRSTGGMICPNSFAHPEEPRHDAAHQDHNHRRRRHRGLAGRHLSGDPARTPGRRGPGRGHPDRIAGHRHRRRRRGDGLLNAALAARYGDRRARVPVALQRVLQTGGQVLRLEPRRRRPAAGIRPSLSRRRSGHQRLQAGRLFPEIRSGQGRGELRRLSFSELRADRQLPRAAAAGPSRLREGRAPSSIPIRSRRASSPAPGRRRWVPVGAGGCRSIPASAPAMSFPAPFGATRKRPRSSCATWPRPAPAPSRG